MIHLFSFHPAKKSGAGTVPQRKHEVTRIKNTATNPDKKHRDKLLTESLREQVVVRSYRLLKRKISEVIEINLSLWKMNYK